jgi:hypothetical protein
LLGNYVSVGTFLRLYNEDLRQLERKLRESLEAVVEDDREEEWFVNCSNKL